MNCINFSKCNTFHKIRDLHELKQKFTFKYFQKFRQVQNMYAYVRCDHFNMPPNKNNQRTT